MPPTIRPGKPADARGLVRLHAASSTGTLQGRFLRPVAALTAAEALSLLSPQGGFSLVTERDDAIAGIITVVPRPHDPEVAEAGLWVGDPWHGKGIGTSLLVAAARSAASAGYQEMMITVLPTNRAVMPMVNAAGLRARVSTREGRTYVAFSLASLRNGRRAPVVTSGTPGSGGTA